MEVSGIVEDEHIGGSESRGDGSTYERNER